MLDCHARVVAFYQQKEILPLCIRLLPPPTPRVSDRIAPGTNKTNASLNNELSKGVRTDLDVRTVPERFVFGKRNPSTMHSTNISPNTESVQTSVPQTTPGTNKTEFTFNDELSKGIRTDLDVPMACERLVFGKPNSSPMHSTTTFPNTESFRPAGHQNANAQSANKANTRHDNELSKDVRMDLNDRISPEIQTVSAAFPSGKGNPSPIHSTTSSPNIETFQLSVPQNAPSKDNANLSLNNELWDDIRKDLDVRTARERGVFTFIKANHSPIHSTTTSPNTESIRTSVPQNDPGANKADTMFSKELSKDIRSDVDVRTARERSSVPPKKRNVTPNMESPQPLVKAEPLNVPTLPVTNNSDGRLKSELSEDVPNLREERIVPAHDKPHSPITADSIESSVNTKYQFAAVLNKSDSMIEEDLLDGFSMDFVTKGETDDDTVMPAQQLAESKHARVADGKSEEFKDLFFLDF